MNDPLSYDPSQLPSKIFPGSVMYLPQNSMKRLRSSTDSAAAKSAAATTKKETSSFIFSRRKWSKSMEETKNDKVSPTKSVVPIFVQKTYRMVEEGDSSLIEWSSDGEMFVVKDKKKLAKQVIPNYFDHSKFASFDRQLNFYGFRKIQNKPVWNRDYDPKTAEYAIYHNENFKRGRTDLLLNIERSTKQKNDTNKSEEVNSLHERVTELTSRVDTLEQKLVQNNSMWEYRFAVLQRQMTLMVTDPTILSKQHQQQGQEDSIKDENNDKSMTNEIEKLRKEFAQSPAKSTPIPSEHEKNNSLTSVTSVSMPMLITTQSRTRSDMITVDNLPSKPNNSITREFSTESTGIDMDSFLRDLADSTDSNARRLSVLSLEALPSPEIPL